MVTRLPDEVRAELRRTGRRFDPETIQAAYDLFTPLHEAVDHRAPVVDRDRAYGPDPRHRLDVHTDPAVGAGAPVLLFVHGGGFVGGDKTREGYPFYDHLGRWATDHGLVGVTMTYRLAPDFRWPSAAEDIAAAVAWLGEHAEEYGGDPHRIVVMGQSAGASHVASYVAGHGGPVADGVVGAVMMSGVYDPPTNTLDELARHYYGTDDLAAKSALPGLAASALPLLFAVAELDVPHFHRQATVLLGAMWAAHGVTPLFVTIPDATHLSEVLALGLEGTGLDGGFGDLLARFVARATSGAGSDPGAEVAP